RGKLVFDARCAGDVDPEGGFPDRRAGSDDDHLSGVQAVGDLVEIAETGGDTDGFRTPARRRLDLLQGRADDLTERQVIFGGALFGDRIHFRLRSVDYFVNVAAIGAVPEVDDAGSRLDQTAQHRPLLHDPGVITGIRGGRHRGNEGVQVGGPAYPGAFALARELGSNGDGVGAFAPAVQVDDRVIDRLVRGTVEITSPQHFNDIGDRVLGEHHPTEHTLFRGNVLRRSPIELRCAWSGQVS